MSIDTDRPLFSIIVPVYNTAAYLEQCIDSILGQKFSSLELVLIDDGSTDGSSDICDRYARCDNRISVIHKLNAGVSAARNDGLDVAKGSYIWFVDSDDWISPDALSLLSSRIADFGPSMVCFAFNTIGDDDFQIETIAAPKENLNSFDGPLQCENKLYAWCQVFRRDVTNGIRFDTGLALLEDRDFFYKVCVRAIGDTLSIGQPLYNYRIERQNSAVHEMTTDKAFGAYLVAKNIYECEKLRGYVSPAYESLVSHALSAMSAIGRTEGKSKKYLSIARYLSKNRQTNLLKKSEKAKLRLALSVPTLFISLCKLKAAVKSLEC